MYGGDHVPGDRLRRWLGLKSEVFYDRERVAIISVADAHTGAIAAVQRTDSALRLNVHFHILALDGVTVRDAKSDALVFHTLPTPTRSDVADIARRTAQRIEKILQANGRSLDPAMQDSQDDQPPKLCSDEPGLAACYAAAARGGAASGDRAGLPPLRLLVSPAPAVSEIHDKNDPSAELRGVSRSGRVQHAARVNGGPRSASPCEPKRQRR